MWSRNRGRRTNYWFIIMCLMGLDYERQLNFGLLLLSLSFSLLPSWLPSCGAPVPNQPLLPWGLIPASPDPPPGQTVLWASMSSCPTFLCLDVGLVAACWTGRGRWTDFSYIRRGLSSFQPWMNLVSNRFIFIFTSESQILMSDSRGETHFYNLSPFF